MTKEDLREDQYEEEIVNNEEVFEELLLLDDIVSTLNDED